jgi:N-acetylglutamate synthase-like GNAT family acetyltransferase
VACAIRLYEPRDLPACRALWRELTDVHRRLFADPSIGTGDAEERFDSHLAVVGAERIWVAEADDEVVGFAALVPHGDKAEIEPIVVAPGYRSRGIGRQLAQTAIQRARSEGVRQVFVRPVSRNEKALRLFHDIGFDAAARVELVLDLARGPAWRDGIELAGRRFRI